MSTLADITAALGPQRNEPNWDGPSWHVADELFIVAGETYVSLVADYYDDEHDEYDSTTIADRPLSQWRELLSVARAIRTVRGATSLCAEY